MSRVESVGNSSGGLRRPGRVPYHRDPITHEVRPRGVLPEVDRCDRGEVRIKKNFRNITVKMIRTRAEMDTLENIYVKNRTLATGLILRNRMKEWRISYERMYYVYWEKIDVWLF